MSRKIIILPEFASSHLLKCSLPNWIEVLEPDIIIINSGVFPGGIENKKEIDDEFRKKWCYKNTIAGFDYDETLDFISKLTIERHSGNKKIPHIECRIINYASLDANECFLQAISSPEIFSPGDILLPLEPDVLFHENDKKKIQEELQRLTPGDGIQVVWKDFLETQFYTELINEVSPKWRRFAYCFDSMENYRNAMNAFMTQNYRGLRKVNSFFSFHYPWFCPEPWKQLRFDLIYRKDPQYWKDFENGLQEIRHKSEFVILSEMRRDEHIDKILIRPSRTDEARWAKFIDISHPKHIHSHPNFVK